MARFFVDKISGDEIIITGSDAVHISKSLRLKLGGQIRVSEQKGLDYLCEIISIDNKAVVARVLEKQENIAEAKVGITLYQALPKGSKLELIVQKNVELGIVRIVPVITEFCVSRPDKKAMSKKIERLQTISLEAAKQSGRGIVPEIGELLTFKQAIDEMKSSEKAVLFYEKATDKLSDLLETSPATIAIMIGSEGGFSMEEAKHAETEGIKIASLGTRILRCETASIAAVAGIMYGAGEF